MCLRRPLDNNIPHAKKYWYKILKYTRDGDLINSFNKGLQRPYEWSKLYNKSEFSLLPNKKIIYAYCRDEMEPGQKVEKYPSGFHCFYSKEEAKSLMDILVKYHTYTYIIVRVTPFNLLAYGTEVWPRKEFRVGVFNYIKLIEPLHASSSFYSDSHQILNELKQEAKLRKEKYENQKNK